MSISGSDRPIKWRCAGTSLRDTALSYAPWRIEYTLTELTKKKKNQNRLSLFCICARRICQFIKVGVYIVKRELIEQNMKLQVHANSKLDEMKKSKTKL